MIIDSASSHVGTQRPQRARISFARTRTRGDLCQARTSRLWANGPVPPRGVEPLAAPGRGFSLL